MALSVRERLVEVRNYMEQLINAMYTDINVFFDVVQKLDLQTLAERLRGTSTTADHAKAMEDLTAEHAATTEKLVKEHAKCMEEKVQENSRLMDVITELEKTVADQAESMKHHEEEIKKLEGEHTNVLEEMRSQPPITSGLP